MALVGEATNSPYCEYECVGQTVNGRSIDCLKIGTGPNICWLHARTHPGETQAEWWMAGLIPELLSDSPVSVELRKKATIYIIPSMNPDGAVMGHLRTNARGANLNREWCDTPQKSYKAPLINRSPEVLYVLEKMKKTGCDFYLDVHGDEELPACFLATGTGCPNWSPRLESLYEKLGLEMEKECAPYMQNGIGYGNGMPGQGYLCIATRSVIVEFDCVAATLEMPYKAITAPVCKSYDHTDCEKFGRSFAQVLLNMQPDLRRTMKESEIPERQDWAKPGYKCPDWKQPVYESGN